MNIVLNEYEWAERAIREKDLGKKPTETLSRIAKYYIYKENSGKETRKMIEEFLVRCDPGANPVKWSDTLDRIVRFAERYPIIMIDGISITEPEIKKIRSIEGRQLQRLAFTLLCVAKYLYSVSDKNDFWVSTPDNEIMKMANIRTSVKRQSMMFGQLKDAGMIRFSKKIDNLSVQVLFAEEGKEELRVTDFRNLGYQYLKYLGEPYFYCECCGVATKIRDTTKGNKKKYCDDCAAKIHLAQRVNSVMRHRAELKN